MVKLLILKINSIKWQLTSHVFPCFVEEFEAESVHFFYHFILSDSVLISRDCVGEEECDLAATYSDCVQMIDKMRWFALIPIPCLKHRRRLLNNTLVLVLDLHKCRLVMAPWEYL